MQKKSSHFTHSVLIVKHRLNAARRAPSRFIRSFVASRRRTSFFLRRSRYLFFLSSSRASRDTPTRNAKVSRGRPVEGVPEYTSHADVNIGRRARYLR